MENDNDNEQKVFNPVEPFTLADWNGKQTRIGDRGTLVAKALDSENSEEEDQKSITPTRGLLLISEAINLMVFFYLKKIKYLLETVAKKI